MVMGESSLPRFSVPVLRPVGLIFRSITVSICCNYGNGRYEVFLDGESVATGGKFQKSETKPVGECDSPTVRDKLDLSFVRIDFVLI